VFLGLNLYLGNLLGEFVGALRNALPAVQPIADINNALLPLWMMVLGVSFIWQSRRE